MITSLFFIGKNISCRWVKYAKHWWLSPNIIRMATRPHFISINPRLRNISDIPSFIGTSLSYQDNFNKIISPSERSRWSDEQLSTFKIIPDQITRVFFIKSVETYDDADGKFLMHVRMKYNDRDLYVELSGFNEPIPGSSEMSAHGTIYISEDVSLFLEVVQTALYPIDLVRQLLTKDDIVLNRVDRLKVKQMKQLKGNKWYHIDRSYSDCDDDSDDSDSDDDDDDDEDDNPFSEVPPLTL